MSKAKFGATCAAVVLSCAFVSTQTYSPVSAPAAAAQSNRGRAPDKPLPNRDAAKSPQAATITGCVVRDAANGAVHIGLHKPVLLLVERQRAYVPAPELGSVDRDAQIAGLFIVVASHADVDFMSYGSDGTSRRSALRLSG